ncbi:MAG: putative glycoside hydrolase [Luteolibacter sp.]
MKTKRIIPIVILLAYTPISILQAAPGEIGEWEKTRLYHHFGKGSSRDLTAEEYVFAADNYGMSIIEKTHAANFYGGNPGHEIAARETAKNLIEDNPDVNPLIYFSSTLAFPELFESTAEAFEDNPEFFFTSERSVSGWEMDVTNSSARDWWVDVTNDNIANSELVGVFVDAVTNATKDGNLDDVEDMMSRVNGLTIFNGFDVDSEAKILSSHQTIEHTDGVWVEDFFRGRCNSLERAICLLEELLKIDNDKIIVTHCDPGGWSTTHQLSHRAHLLVANEYTYYHWDAETTDELTFWHSDYGREMGAPLGSAVGDGYVYTRRFENCTVSVDLDNRTSSASWNENNKNNSNIATIYEAEDSTFSHAAEKSNTTASTNSYVDGNNGAMLSWSIIADGGEDILSFRIKSPSGTRSMGVYVNGVKQGEVTAFKKTWNARSVPVVLANGSNTIELRDSESTAELDVDYLSLPIPNRRKQGPLQAEASVYSSGTVKTDREISREEYVDGNSGFNLLWYVRSEGLTREVAFNIKSPSGNRAMGVYLNGTKIGTVSTSLSNWNTKTRDIFLPSGVNTIELRDSQGTAELDVDYMIVRDH